MDKESTKKMFYLIDSLALISIGLFSLLALIVAFYLLIKDGITIEGNFLFIMHFIFSANFRSFYKDYKEKQKERLGTAGEGK